MWIIFKLDLNDKESAEPQQDPLGFCMFVFLFTSVLFSL